MPELLLDDITLHYEVDGSGPPLLLIAGMASDSASWAPLVPLLAPHFTVIRPDNRMTGRTRPIEAAVSLPLYAADCAALLAHLGLGAAHVMGHSMGGLIAMQLAASHADQVATLSLLASAPLRSGRNQHILETMVDLRDSGAPEDLWLRSFYPWLFTPSFFDDPANVPGALSAAMAYAHAQGAAAMRRQVEALKELDAQALVPQISAPVQAILGAQDLLYPLEPTKAALNQFVNIRLEIIEQAAHSAHWDAPDLVAEHLRAFITNAGATA